jgi:hypothetical protein
MSTNNSFGAYRAVTLESSRTRSAMTSVLARALNMLRHSFNILATMPSAPLAVPRPARVQVRKIPRQFSSAGRYAQWR